LIEGTKEVLNLRVSTITICTMAKFTEETFNNWRYPPSDSEETKLANAQRMVREALSADSKLRKLTIEVFGQGSYANDTNVKLNSDIDINVRYMDAYYYELPTNKTLNDFGQIDSPSAYTYAQYKNDVEQALVNHFGRDCIVRNDKCITVKANTYRVEADVVPTWEYRRYYENGNFSSGTKFFSDKGSNIINFPLQHIENGKSKNSLTQKRFKRLTRIYRTTRYRMIDERVGVSDNITSFLLECLVWNVPDSILNNNNTWTDRLKQSIIHLYEKTNSQETCKEWGEVSELFYLFHTGRKWSREDVNSYLVQMWNYLGFA
jgi:hypothetical protein